MIPPLLQQAVDISKEATCRRRRVGAVLSTIDGDVAGVNRAVAGDCMQGDCLRCKDEEYGLRFDLCRCMHAEEVAVLKGLQMGYRLDGSVMYCSLQPCFACLRTMIAVGVVSFIYAKKIDLPAPFETEYFNFIEKAGLRHEFVRCLGTTESISKVG